MKIVYPLVLGVFLSGCSTLGISGSTATSVQSDAMKGVGTVLTAYADVYQPAVIAYGSLPLCPTATLCKDAATLTKLKTIDASVVSVIQAAKPILDGTASDAGQLAAAVKAVQAAEIAIAQTSAGELLKN